MNLDNLDGTVLEQLVFHDCKLNKFQIFPQNGDTSVILTTCNTTKQPIPRSKTYRIGKSGVLHNV